MCCISFPPLRHTFTVEIDIRPCEFKLYVAIDGLHFEESLIEFTFGETKAFSLFGLVSAE